MRRRAVAALLALVLSSVLVVAVARAAEGRDPAGAGNTYEITSEYENHPTSTEDPGPGPDHSEGP